MQLVSQISPFDGQYRKVLMPVLHMRSGLFAQDHLRVVNEVAVDGKTVCIFAQVYPIRFNLYGAVTLLQEDDVRYNLCASIGLEGIVGQADCAQQFRALRKIAAHIRRLLIHGVARGDKGHHAARTHLIQRLGKKVVVNRKTELVVSPVVDLIVAKGYIADGQIEEVLPVRRFKTCHGDMRLGIKLFGDSARDAVQFHTVQAAVLHRLRQHAEEVAHAHRRFKDVPRGEAHIGYGFVDGTDYRRTGVVCVECRCAGCFILILRKNRAQRLKLVRPCCVVRVKGFRQAAPAHIAGQRFLFIGRGLPLFLFQRHQQTDSVHVHAVLGFCTAFAQMLVRNSVVCRRLSSWCYTAYFFRDGCFFRNGQPFRLFLRF